MFKKIVSILLALVLVCCTVSAYAGKAKPAGVAAPGYVGVGSAHSGVEVYWDYVEGCDGYEVYRRVNQGGWKKVATTERVYYLDNNVKVGSTYEYKVAAIYGKAKSAFVEAEEEVVYVPAVRMKKVAIENHTLTVNWAKLSNVQRFFLSVDEYNEKGEYVKTVFYDSNLSKSKTSYEYKKCRSGYRYVVYLYAIIEKNGKKYEGVSNYLHLYDVQ